MSERAKEQITKESTQTSTKVSEMISVHEWHVVNSSKLETRRGRRNMSTVADCSSERGGL